MIYEQADSFTNSLLEKTKAGELEWKVFTSCEKVFSMLPEIELATGADMGVNTVAYWRTYYLEHKEGYVFLVYLYHGDPSVTSPEQDTICLMVKVNNVLPIENLSSHIDGEEHQQKLSIIKALIDDYYEKKYSMPETLYAFMYDLINS